MLDTNSLTTAISRLERLSGFTGSITKTQNKENDGILILKKGTLKFEAIIEAKNNLRDAHLIYLKENKIKFNSYIVISNYISDNLKQKLRDENIFYLDTSGNAYIANENIHIFIQGLKKLSTEKIKVSKAFNGTGLRVIYALLAERDLYKANYRTIALRSEVALGSVAGVMNDLKEMGYLIELDENSRKIIKWKQLLDRWVVEYGESLRPRLFIEKFRLLGNQQDWRTIKLTTSKSVWGGEPAGELLTDYLKSEKLILYTLESRSHLMKSYKLVPDSGGNITSYKWFWTQHIDSKYNNDRTSGPILTYADLMLSNDSRNIETAHKIYEKFISYPD